MLKIAICDDMTSVCSELENMLTLYSGSINERFDIELYYTGEKLCDDLKAGAYFDLIFLDIEMPNVDGVSVGKYIRNAMRNYNVEIIYISSHERYAMELFQFKPFDFLMKPLKQETVNGIMEKYIEVSSKNYSVFRYGEGKNAVAVYVKDILYFTIKSRVIELFTLSEKKVFYGKLKDVAAKLEKHQFFYANKSQLVNCRRIKEWGHDTLVMENNEKIMISQGRRKKVAEVHKEYIKNTW